MKFCTHFGSILLEDGKRVIMSGMRATGITDAAQLGTKNLPCIDPFNDIDPMLTRQQLLT